MLCRPSLAAPYSWSVIEVVLYCLDYDLCKACLIWTLDALPLEMVVDSSDKHGLSVIARRSCNKVRFLDYPDDPMYHFDNL